MNICLINPPSPFLLDDRVVPTLGVLQVASALEQDLHNVRVLDLAGCDEVVMLEQVRTAVQHACDVVGVTATTPQFPYAMVLLRLIRRERPDIRVIIGGPHATVQPESCSEFDCVVLGDGEEAVLQAIHSWAPKQIDAASTTKKGELQWHWPARHLIDMNSYKYSLRGRSGTSMLWSMGCPFGCLWCSGRFLPFYRRQRQRNSKDVVREAEHLVERYGISAVTAYDDEVNIQSSVLIDLCNQLSPLGMKFRAFIKANLFTDEQAEAMVRAGFVEVCSGIESGSDRILGIMQKQTTYEINKQAREIARRHGLYFKAFCSIGHVGETYDDAMKTREWLLDVKPDDFDVTCLTIYPGTPIYAKREFIGEQNGHRVCRYVHKSEHSEENGAILYFEEVDYSSSFSWYKGKPGEYVSHVWTPDLSKTDLVALRDEIEDDVRTKLGIPYPKRFSGDHLSGAENFEHSYGAGVNTQDSRVQLRVPEIL